MLAWRRIKRGEMIHPYGLNGSWVRKWRSAVSQQANRALLPGVGT